MQLIVYILCIWFAVVISPICVFAGNIKIWTDENGVTHIEYEKQRSVYEYEELKSVYESEIEKEKRRFQIERKKRDRKTKRIMEDYGQKIKRLKHSIERDIANDRRQREKERQKSLLDIEIKQAKRDWEYKKNREHKYRQYYREASSSKYRKEWKEKLDEINEAQKKYESLKHKQLRK
jgi:hypothetical protein